MQCIVIHSRRKEKDEEKRKRDEMRRAEQNVNKSTTKWGLERSTADY